MVIVFDPKGDADLLKHVVMSRPSRLGVSASSMWMPGWPDISARYNAVGRFGRISGGCHGSRGTFRGRQFGGVREFRPGADVNIIAGALIEAGAAA